MSDLPRHNLPPEIVEMFWTIYELGYEEAIFYHRLGPGASRPDRRTFKSVLTNSGVEADMETWIEAAEDNDD